MQRYATNIQVTPFWLWLWLGVGKSSCVEAQESSTVESGFEVFCPSSVLARTLWSSEIIEAIQGLFVSIVLAVSYNSWQTQTVRVSSVVSLRDID